MKNEKSILLLLLILITLMVSVSSVSAQDLNNMDEVDNGDTNGVTLEEQSDDLSSDEGDNDLIKQDNKEILSKNAGSFFDLNNKINNNSDTEIYLDMDYEYKLSGDENYTSGILINRSLTIYGNGHSITGVFLARAFQVNASNVIFKDIVFSACGKRDSGVAYNGGAINVLGSNANVSAINCEFDRCQGYTGGGTYNCTAIHCTFDKCDAYYSGGAMQYGEAINCSFTDNKAKMGGAAYQCNATYCNFTGNEATEWEGGAILWGKVLNCIFKNNKANLDGGAVFEADSENCIFENNEGWNGGAITYAKLKNCTFKNNKAREGGAAYYCNAVNCTFTSNYGYIASYTSSSYTRGGAMYAGSATNCTFNYNYAHSGGAIYVSGTSYIINCTFEGNSATGGYTTNGFGGAGYCGNYENCVFISNSANRRGGALYTAYAVNCTFSRNTVPTYEGTGTYKGTSILCTYLGGNSYYDTKIPTDLIKTGGKTFVDYPEEVVLPYKLEYNGREFNGYNMSITLYKDGKNLGTYYNLSGSSLRLNLSVGAYSIYFALVDYGNEYNRNLNFQVRGIPITFTANKLDITCLEEGYIVGTLKETNSGLPLVGYNITLNHGSTIKDSSVTDSNGQVKFLISGLGLGYYYYNLVFDGNNQYDKKSIYTEIIVRTVNPIIYASDIDILYGHTTNLVVRLGDELNNNLTGRNLSVEFNGNKLNLTTNGTSEISLPIPILSPENYTVSISFKGNKTYSDATKQININVYQIKTQINSSDVRAIFNEGKVIATFKTVSGEALEDYMLFIYVGDKVFNGTTDANGQIEVDLVDLAEGNYTATISYVGKELYANSTANIKVWIGRYITSIFAENAAFVYKEGGYIIATLLDEFNQPLANKTVTVLDSSNSNKNLTTQGNGQVKFEIDKDLYIGDDYWVNFTYVGSYRYINSSIVVNYRITKISTQIESANVTTVYNEGKELVVTLKDKYGDPIKYANITVIIAGSTFRGATDENGQFNVTTKGLPAKNFTATVDFAGTDIYISSEAEVSIVVNKASTVKEDTKIISQTLTTIYNNCKDLVVTLTDDKGNVIKNAKVSIKVNGITYTKTTDDKGQAKLPINLPPGTYIATIKFAGNGNYNKASSNVKIVVKKATPRIVASNKAFKVKANTKSYSFTLKDNRNNPLKNAQVTIKVNGKTYSAKTDSKGVATFKFTKLTKVGNYKAAISFGGNKYYTSQSKSITISVKR